MKANENEIPGNYTFVKRYGLFGFLFFLGKGLLWLIVPFVMAYFGISIK